MAIKKQTPTTIELINNQIKHWLRWQDKCKLTTTFSDNWYVYLRERNACWDLIIRTTGLDLNQAYDLIYNKTNTASYWLPDGQIRKDHP
jgi:hypothetical protein